MNLIKQLTVETIDQVAIQFFLVHLLSVKKKLM